MIIYNANMIFLEAIKENSKINFLEFLKKNILF
ncbi:hypothetical protein SAMN04488529_11425 [Clostridium gasigenes]|uniref:Uncharacterized protein n=1 Tax=Clostridium gasigenes TaxID=94869 RepID=A0A1H0V3X7_9CLOT|nr:hypothetical protein SAMN04488529_11425 [Clostridium gasigenes]